MKRNEFLKNILGVLMGIGNLSFMTKKISEDHQKNSYSNEFVSFGAVHLNNTDIQKAIAFWTKIGGMKLRSFTVEQAELGTQDKTLVVVHQAALYPFKEGYSGLYHFAIHAPNKDAFAKMLYRLTAHRYPFSLVDHIMSKSIYLEDPDGIQVEFTLETPERFSRVIPERGLQIETADGKICEPSTKLDVNEVLLDLKDKNMDTIIPEGTKIGHIHFYVNNVIASNTFYKKLGLEEFNFLPAFRYADLGSGGSYRHRVAMNSWHGINNPAAPETFAGLNYFHLIYKSKDTYDLILKTQTGINDKFFGFWMTDPTGNKLFLSYQKT